MASENYASVLQYNYIKWDDVTLVEQYWLLSCYNVSLFESEVTCSSVVRKGCFSPCSRRLPVTLQSRHQSEKRSTLAETKDHRDQFTNLRAAQLSRCRGEKWSHSSAGFNLDLEINTTILLQQRDTYRAEERWQHPSDFFRSLQLTIQTKFRTAKYLTTTQRETLRPANVCQVISWGIVFINWKIAAKHDRRDRATEKLSLAPRDLT